MVEIASPAKERPALQGGNHMRNQNKIDLMEGEGRRE
jgi:hypothetical protein